MSESTLPAATNPPNTDLEVYREFSDVDDGLGSIIEQFGVATPRIVTNMKFGYQPFVDELTGDVIEAVRATILGSTVGRAWWESDETIKGVPPDCRSVDSIKPDAASPQLQNDVCATCPQAQWGINERTNKQERPACRQSALVLVYDYDREGPRILRVAGTSIKRFDRYVSVFRTSKKFGKAFEYVTHITAEVVPDDYDKHHEMVFTLGERLPVDAIRELLAMRDAIGWQQALADDIARGESDVEPTAQTGASGGGGTYTPGPDEEPFVTGLMPRSGL